MDYLKRKWRELRYWRLIKLEKEDTELFSLEGNRYVAKCIDVYDGDTITVIFKFNHKYQQFKIRMMGYDSPEIRTRNKEEKKEGLKAKKVLADEILDELIDLECHEFDKYGRLLGTIYIDGRNINQFMIDEGYGYKYMGGTKKVFGE